MKAHRGNGNFLALCLSLQMNASVEVAPLNFIVASAGKSGNILLQENFVIPRKEKKAQSNILVNSLHTTYTQFPVITNLPAATGSGNDGADFVGATEHV